MKFIIRNLGWILLILFFGFMLYLISTQNNEDSKKNLTINSGSTTSENKKVKNNEIVKKISNEIKVNSNINNGGFINSIKTLFTKDKNNIDDIITSTGVLDEKLIKKIKKNISINEGSKNRENIDINKYDNNIRKVGVKSIFLNDAYFTKRLYTAYKGDKLKKLTNTNRYGCFKVRVISSKHKENNGKIAWTCEYYMEGKTKTLEKYKIVTKNYYKNIKQSKNVLKIKNNYKVKVKSLKLNNSTFNKKLGIIYFGDKLEQITSINKYGCFKMKVLSSKNPINNGKIAWTCKKYLK